MKLWRQVGLNKMLLAVMIWFSCCPYSGQSAHRRVQGRGMNRKEERNAEYHRVTSTLGWGHCDGRQHARVETGEQVYTGKREIGHS